MSRRIGISLVAILLFADTALGSQTITAPSGEVLTISKCHGSPQGCYAEAGQHCKGPYQVFDSESHAGGLLADLFPGPVTWYSMVYRCGKSDGRLPTFEFRGPHYRAPAFASCSMFGQSVFCWGQ
jgi:hypothetical protein